MSDSKSKSKKKPTLKVQVHNLEISLKEEKDDFRCVECGNANSIKINNGTISRETVDIDFSLFKINLIEYKKNTIKSATDKYARIEKNNTEPIKIKTIPKLFFFKMAHP